MRAHVRLQDSRHLKFQTEIINVTERGDPLIPVKREIIVRSSYGEEDPEPRSTTR